MKVSEAVFELREEAETGTMSPVRRKQLETLLNSHEALRLAGARLLDAPRPMVSNRVFVDAYDALSLAVEDAGR